MPTGLSATNPTLSTIDLAWDAASDATGHKLFRDTSSTGPFDRVIDVGNATSWTYDGLTSGIAYYFRASSYNSFGESAKSAAVWATTGNIPSTPTGLHSDNATLTSVDLEWSTSVGATGYRLYRDAAINGSYATQHDVGSATAYTDMGLSSGTTYYYKVSAYNEFGESPLSSAVTGSACRNYYRDQDGDGYGIDDVICSATPTGPYTALQSGDCDDGAALVYPGAVEICDTKDNDCDGQVDEAGASGCVTYYLDVDGDTYGVTADSKCLCAPEGFYSASTRRTALDSNSAVNPGASEVCDGLDNDCNGRTDSADSGLVLTLCELQLGVCAGKKHSASQCVGGSWLSCGLANYGSYYGTERCDTRDNDCDGQIDEEGALGCSIYYADGDGDGYGTTSKCLCAPSGIYTATAGGDCDDSNTAVKPGAQEICDGIDNDCDGLTDGADPSLLLTSCELQLGVCTGKKHAASQCVAGSWLACDASNYGSSYGTEICDSKDNDCNGLVDDNASGCTYYYYDGDADGYGVESNTMCLCAPTGLYTATVTGDCNDAIATVHPGASEICDSWDNDCDTVVDECGPASADQAEPNNSRTLHMIYHMGPAIQL